MQSSRPPAALPLARSCLLILILIFIIILIPNWPTTTCPSWCMEPLLTSACHSSWRCMCLLVMLREEWRLLGVSWRWGGRPPQATRCPSLGCICSFMGHGACCRTTHSTREGLEFNGANRDMKFRWRSGLLLCFSAEMRQARFWNPAAWPFVLVKLRVNDCHFQHVLQPILSHIIHHFLNSPKLTQNTGDLSDQGPHVPSRSFLWCFTPPQALACTSPLSMSRPPREGSLVGVRVLASQIRKLKQRKVKGLLSAERTPGPTALKLGLTARHVGDLYGRGWGRSGGVFLFACTLLCHLAENGSVFNYCSSSCLPLLLFATCILLEKSRDF